MSDEYFGVAAGVDACGSAILDQLLSDKRFAVLAPSDGTLIRLRFADTNPGDLLREDARIRFTNEHVYVGVHWSTGNQPDNLLEFLETALAKLGYSVKFEED